MGILVEFSYYEGVFGQQEIDLWFVDVLLMVDNVMIFCYVIKEVVLEEGVWVLFMFKLFGQYLGLVMYIYMSLFEGDVNVFYSVDDLLQLLEVGKLFIVGILEYVCEISVVINQWVNFYKWLVQGGEVFMVVLWGVVN